MRVIALSNQKGGCGKTTSAINVAASLASMGRRTLLVDLDPQAHATYGVGIRGDEARCSMFHVLTEDLEKRRFIENAILPVTADLDLAPSHVLLSTIEQEFTNKDEAVSRLRTVLANLAFPYEYVVIDCPPSLGFLTFNALRAADVVIVPIELGSFSLVGVGKLLSMIELIRVKLQHTPLVYALPTIVDLRTRFSRHMMEEIGRAFGDHILTTPIRQSVSVRESQAKGVPALLYDPKSIAAADYLRLTRELLERLDPPAAPHLGNGASSAVPSRLLDFVFKNNAAREVYLVGDFNNWSITPESLLWRRDSGVWQKRVLLPPGRYRYKYVVDGRWTHDPDNNCVVPNPYGDVDSLIDVG